MFKNKIIFFSIWLTLLAFAPVTIYLNGTYTLLSTLQRLVGLLIYILMFIQIILGTYMTVISEKFGGWIYKFHIYQGLLIYFLIIIHMLSYVFINFFAGKPFDPFFVFVDVCVLCGSVLDYYLNFGRIAFWLLTTGILAGLFRTIYPFLRVHWKKFHILNYFAFISIGVHSLFVGTDIGTFPFSIVHGPFLAIATVLGAKEATGILRSAFSSWWKS